MQLALFRLYLNTDYAKEHLIFENYTKLSSELKGYFKEKITSQIGADKLNSTGGIYINAEHESSKKLSNVLINNQEFIQKTAKVRKSLEAGNFINTDVQFKYGNFHYALGKADIRSMHINKNGDIDLLVTDVYDFNKNDPSDLVQVARERQDRGEIKPYFIIYHVIIPKRTILKDKKQNDNKNFKK